MSAPALPPRVKDWRDPTEGLIDGDTGLPVEYVSCPSCGRRYGAWGRKVCTACDECVACCCCAQPQLRDGRDYKINVAAKNA